MQMPVLRGEEAEEELLHMSPIPTAISKLMRPCERVYDIYTIPYCSFMRETQNLDDPRILLDYEETRRIFHRTFEDSGFVKLIRQELSGEKKVEGLKFELGITCTIHPVISVLKHLQYVEICGDSDTKFAQFKAITNMPSIKTLVLSNMKKLVVGEELLKMTNLETIYIRDYRCDGDDKDHAYDVVFKMKNLKNLVLDRCNSDFFMKADLRSLESLVTLTLDTMYLEYLPATLTNIRTLKELHLVRINHDISITDRRNKKKVKFDIRPLSSDYQYKQRNPEIGDFNFTNYFKTYEGPMMYKRCTWLEGRLQDHKCCFPVTPGAYTDYSRVEDKFQKYINSMDYNGVIENSDGLVLPYIENLTLLSVIECSGISRLEGDIARMSNLKTIHIERCQFMHYVCDIPPINLQTCIVKSCYEMVRLFNRIDSSPRTIRLDACNSLQRITTIISDTCAVNKIHITNCMFNGKGCVMDLGVMPSVQSLSLYGAIYSENIDMCYAAFPGLTRLKLYYVIPYTIVPAPEVVAVAAAAASDVAAENVNRTEDYTALERFAYCTFQVLTELILINLGIRRIPEHIISNAPNIEKLVITGCDMLTLSSHIYQFRHLVHLEVQLFEMTRHRLPDYNPAMGDNYLAKSLETLIITDALALPNGMLRLPRLHTLTLNQCIIIQNEDYYNTLLMPSLTNLSIMGTDDSRCYLRGELLVYFISNATELETIEITSTTIGPGNTDLSGIQQLFNLAYINYRHLLKFILRGVDFMIF